MIAGQVQDKIPCLFETDFNEETKENLATHKLRSEILSPSSPPPIFPIGNSEQQSTTVPAQPKSTIMVKTTVKIDGTCCMIRNGQLWKRFDKKLNRAGNDLNRKLQKLIREKKKSVSELRFNLKKHYKDTPEGWIPADANVHVINQEYHSSQHIVGWVPVSCVERQDMWHVSCMDRDMKHVYLLTCDEQGNTTDNMSGENGEKRSNLLNVQVKKVPIDAPELQNGTFELIGPKINGNIYGFPGHSPHFLVGHGSVELPRVEIEKFMSNVHDLNTIDRDRLIEWFRDEQNPFSKIEGLVWHVLHAETGQVLQMYKVHQHHLGLEWPNGANSEVGVLFSYQEQWSGVLDRQ